MKIGILTYHAACNFGANLQVLSSVSYFRNNNIQVEVINWLPIELEEIYKRKTPDVQVNCHEQFRLKNLPLSRLCRDENDIARIIDEDGIDAVIVGSDAVVQHHPWLSRLRIRGRKILSIKNCSADRLFPNPFWGSFLHACKKNIPLVMMSVSCQNSPYHFIVGKQRRLMKDAINHFSLIFTRDDWTSKMFHYLTGGSIFPLVTPDPVFGFNHNVSDIPSRDEIYKRFGLQKDYILLSFHNSRTVSKKWQEEFKTIAGNNGLECVALPFPQGLEFNCVFEKRISLPLDPIDWYALIKYSKAYVGDNMHPIVISLHNAVPCFSFDHYGIVNRFGKVNEGSSKVYHIMKRYGLLENRVSLLGKYNEPSASYVWERIKGVNQDNIKKQSDVMLSEYLEMMDLISNSLKKGIE